MTTRKVKRDAKGKWAKGTKSPNPKGAPKRGQSWAEVIKEISELTPDEARELSAKIFAHVDIHDPVTIKQAVIMRVYAALMFDPQPGLLNAFMERAEGKIKDEVSLSGSVKVIEVKIKKESEQ
jgi:hypothetical protein